MSKLQYAKPKPVSLKDHPELNERWLQDRIAEDPSILGLGDLILKDRERMQPRAGRLDILLQDAESNVRYEVEIQLGKTDESHIIRTIEYWDTERKRYPQYDHVAVLVAEDITSRFLNVISLFNGVIPLIAIQLSAIQINETISLVFATVLDQRILGLIEEDDEEKEVTDRSYWERRGSKRTVAMADEILKIAKEFDPELELKYNKFYIGVTRQGSPFNFVLFRAQKQALRAEFRLERSEEIRQKLEDSGLDFMDYDTRGGRYRIRLSETDISKHKELLQELLQQAYNEFGG